MTAATRTSTLSISRQAIPPLANGDHLTRAEFERRYSAMPENVRAELIEGIVYMSPAVRFREHSKPHAVLMGWLTYYVAKTPGLELGLDGTVRLGNDNEPQPDAFLILPPGGAGGAIIDNDGYISGPPALVCEVAASSVSIDLHAKKEVYRRHGVAEYLVWRTEDAAFEWYVLDAGEYQAILPQPDGILCSHMFPGLCLDPAALLATDFQRMFQLLDQTTATPEHAAFVACLKPMPSPAV